MSLPSGQHLVGKNKWFNIQFRVKIQASRSHHWLIGIQPLGRFSQEPESSQATGMALARCIQGKFLGVCCFPLPLDVPTFAVRCLHVLNNASAPRSERWNCGRISYPQFSRNDKFSTPFRDILHAANLRHGRRLSFLSEGRHTEEILPEKSDGFGRV
jgi:hypothetical protein